MQELDGIIAAATSKIETEYFLLPIDGGEPVYRERVYCYELYHQMRTIWPRPHRFGLNGEVDKQGHDRLAALGVGGQKPDLLVHVPGNMGGNHAVIEVKPATAKPDGLKKDLTTLALFRNSVRYERAILLVYGHQNEKLLTETVAELAEQIDGTASVELWVHAAVGIAAKKLGAVETLERS